MAKKLAVVDMRSPRRRWRGGQVTTTLGLAPALAHLVALPRRPSGTARSVQSGPCDPGDLGRASAFCAAPVRAGHAQGHVMLEAGAVSASNVGLSEGPVRYRVGRAGPQRQWKAVATSGTFRQQSEAKRCHREFGHAAPFILQAAPDALAPRAPCRWGLGADEPASTAMTGRRRQARELSLHEPGLIFAEP